jgi:ubiquinone/menaquinone biosynthesis C-methylase UbiE
VRLNAVEAALMHNPLRVWLQRHYEAPLLTRLGGPIDGLRVLEIGCGRGVGSEILLRRGARQMCAFDLDERFVRRARARLAHAADRICLSVADATAIPAADASFDAVFDFGIIHHVPAWRAAVAEVRRVLKPGGRFFFEEVTRQALERWVYRTFLVHPAEDRFSADVFVAELERQGIVVDATTQRCYGDFVFGVGHRPRNSQVTIQNSQVTKGQREG